MKCKRCTRVQGGGAACRMGKCKECMDIVSTGAGCLPILCKACSDRLMKCEMCNQEI